jgi:hypothetical protein
MVSGGLRPITTQTLLGTVEWVTMSLDWIAIFSSKNTEQVSVVSKTNTPSFGSFGFIIKPIIINRRSRILKPFQPSLCFNATIL